MKELIAHFKVVNGIPEYKSPAFLKFHLPEFEGCSGALEVRRKWNKRNRGQNNLMWKWLDVLSEQLNISSEELYTICKGLYCPRKRVLEFDIPKGSSELTVGEMTGFMLDIELFAKKRGLKVPSTKEYKDLLNNPQFINQ